MKRLLAALLFAVWFPAVGHAQDAQIVAVCGTAPPPYNSPGSVLPLTMDVNGKLCSNASGGGGTTPGNVVGTIQFNSAGSFGGITDWRSSGVTDLTGIAGSTLAVNGCTIGANNFCVTGSSALAATTVTGSFTATGLVTSADLANTTVTPGSYTNTNLTVNAQGQITAAASGAGAGGPCTTTPLSVQYNNGGSLGCVAGVTSNGTLMTFASSDLIMAGSSTGTTTFQSANAGASNFTITFPAATGTVALTSGANVASVANSDGTLTISPTTGAVTASLALGHTNTWTAAQTFTNNDLVLLGSSTGTTTLNSANAGASNFTISLPAANGTVALTSGANVASVINSDGTLTISPTTGTVTASLALGHANTWTAAQTFTNSDLMLLGSSTGLTTFASANAGASNFTITFPAATGTVALTSGANVASVSNADGTLTISPTTGAVTASLALGHTNTWTAIQTFTNSDIVLLGSSTGATTFTSANVGASNFTLTFPAVTANLDYLVGAATSGHCVQFSGTTGGISDAGAVCGTGGGGVTSISNSDGTLTISPTTGVVTASLALGNSNTWTAAQTFTNSDIILLGSSTGFTTFTSANSSASNFTLTFPAATDQLVGRATTDILTNKTYDTAGTGNVFKINGTQITAISGNTGTVGTTTGALTSTHCVNIDASGNLKDSGSTCGGAGGTPGGANTNIQFNSTGTFGGDSGFTYAGSGGAVTLNSNAIWTAPAAATWQFGAADAASPVAQLIQAQSVAAGTSNTSGVGWDHHGSLATGTGTAGIMTFGTSFSQVTKSGVTVTVTIASPAVVTLAAHGFVPGQPFSFATTGTLPTGITAGTTYYVIATNLAAGTFRFSATPGGAAVNTSGSQSGTQSISSVNTAQNPASTVLSLGPSGLTGSQTTPAVSISQTWNTSGAPSTLLVNTTDLGATSASNFLIAVQRNGVNALAVDSQGIIRTSGTLGSNAGTALMFGSADGSTAAYFNLKAGATTVFHANFGWEIQNGVGYSIASGAVGTTGFFAADVGLFRQGAKTLGLVNTSNPTTTGETFQVYNTLDVITSTPTNYERGILDWNVSANVFTIGTQAGGTGSTRNMQFIIGGTNKLDYGVTTAGTWTMAGNFNAPGVAALSAATTAWLCWTTATGAVSEDSASCITSLRVLKDNITPITGATATLLALKPATFTWKKPLDRNQQGTQLGFIAEDVEQSDPKLASYSRDGKLHGWRQDSVIALLVRGFQEQQKEIEQLKRRASR